jgi:ATP-binding cassette subfamily B (MDR/TAP) protein 1
MVVRDFATAIASFILALYQSWKITLVTISTIPLLAILIPLISSRIQPNVDLQTASLTEAAKHITNGLSDIETVKCFNGQRQEQHRYARLLKFAEMYYTRQVNWSALQASVLRFLTLVMFVQGFWFGSTVIGNNTSGAGTILTAFWSCIMATGALMQIMPQLMYLEKGKLAGHRLRAIMIAELRASTVSEPILIKPDACAGDIAFIDVSQPIKFRHHAKRVLTLFRSPSHTPAAHSRWRCVALIFSSDQET